MRLSQSMQASRPAMIKNTSNAVRAKFSQVPLAIGIQIILVFALFTFLFHFAWEILQTPLFAKMSGASHWQATLVCLQATFGDVGIGLASFAVATSWDRTTTWFIKPSSGAFNCYVATGVLITIAFEWYAVYWAGRWAYSELMPILPILRVGIAPLLQWIIVPPAVLYFLRHHNFSHRRTVNF